jgi:hypothetical protein
VGVLFPDRIIARAWAKPSGSVSGGGGGSLSSISRRINIQKLNINSPWLSSIDKLSINCPSSA